MKRKKVESKFIGNTVRKSVSQGCSKKHRRTVSNDVKSIHRDIKEKFIKTKALHCSSRIAKTSLEHSTKCSAKSHSFEDTTKLRQSISSKKGKVDVKLKEKKGHKRSTSTRIKIDTYLKNEVSKVIQVTQKTNFNSNNLIDVNIINIAIQPYIQHKPLTKKEVLHKDPNKELTEKDLVRLKYVKEVEELKKYIRDYFEKYKEAPATNINFYRIDKLLGKGAFGKVNIAIHKLTGKTVAINKEYLIDELQRRR
jgi:sulfur relay (sulfurtransferase) DsrC/TusE family protein